MRPTWPGGRKWQEHAGIVTEEVIRDLPLEGLQCPAAESDISLQARQMDINEDEDPKEQWGLW